MGLDFCDAGHRVFFDIFVLSDTERFLYELSPEKHDFTAKARVHRLY
jgi:hypothetical protein